MVETTREQRVVAPRRAVRRSVASASAFGVALTAVLGSSVGMAAAAPAPGGSAKPAKGGAAAATGSPAAATSSPTVAGAAAKPGKNNGGNCDSSGSGEALFTVPAGDPPPSYNLTLATPYDPSAPLVNVGQNLGVLYFDEAGFTATGTITGPWTGPPAATPFSDNQKVLTGFTVNPTTHAKSNTGIPISATVPPVASNGPGFYAMTISVGDDDDPFPLPCTVQWLINVAQPTQTLAANVFECISGQPTRVAVPNATLTSSGPSGSAQPSGGSSFPATNVTASPNWGVTAQVPSTFKMVSGCPGDNFPANTVTTSNVVNDQKASESVNVPSNGSGAAVFYATPVANPHTPTLTITKSADVTQVTAGNSFNYSLLVTNNGPGSANDVQVNDTVPAGLRINSVSTGCTFSGRAVTCANLGNLANPGDHLTVAINVTADGTVCGPVVNTGTASATNAPTATSNPVTVTINCPNFNITLQKSASVGNNATITAGTSFTYTLVATNTGGAAAPGVVVTDAVPSQLGISGTPTSTQGTCSLSGNDVNCQVGTLAANGGSATITINVTTSTASCGIVNNMGQVTANGGTTGNSNTVTTTITCPSNPGISVGVVKTNNAQDPTGTDFGKTETAASLGETFNYQAVITNTSTVSEVIGTVTDLIPGQPTQDVCSSLVGTTLSAGGSVTCTFTGVAPSTSGASETDTVTVPVTQVGVPTNTATGTDTSTVLTGPAVLITKANNAAGTGFGNNETVAPGSTSVPYQVTVTNPNSSPGTITALTDTINGTVTNICPDLIGKVLAPSGQPDDSVVCNFTTSVPSSVTTDTAGVTLSVNGTLVSATAQSTVFPPVLGTQITPSNPTPAPATLAFTGAPVGKMLASALGMIAMGLLFLLGLQLAEGRRRSLRFAVAGRGRHTGLDQQPQVPSTWKGGNGIQQTATAAALTWAADRFRGRSGPQHRRL